MRYELCFGFVETESMSKINILTSTPLRLIRVGDDLKNLAKVAQYTLTDYLLDFSPLNGNNLFGLPLYSSGKLI